MNLYLANLENDSSFATDFKGKKCFKEVAQKGYVLERFQNALRTNTEETIFMAIYRNYKCELVLKGQELIVLTSRYNTTTCEELVVKESIVSLEEIVSNRVLEIMTKDLLNKLNGVNDSSKKFKASRHKGWRLKKNNFDEDSETQTSVFMVPLRIIRNLIILGLLFQVLKMAQVFKMF